MSVLGYAGLFLTTACLIEIGTALLDLNHPAAGLVALALLGVSLPLATILTRKR